MEGFIYLIKSVNNDKLYLGSTNNPNNRITEHNKGKCKATSKNVPWKCLLVIKIGTLQEAKKIEYYIKHQKEKLTVKNIIKALNRYFGS
jgi:putative endonuclease